MDHSDPALYLEETTGRVSDPGGQDLLPQQRVDARALAVRRATKESHLKIKYKKNIEHFT